MHEVPDVVTGDFFRFRFELSHLFFQLDEPHFGCFSLLQSEELHDPFMIFNVSVDGDEENSSLEILRDGSESFHDAFVFRVRTADEEKVVGFDLSTENLLGSLIQIKKN